MKRKQTITLIQRDTAHPKSRPVNIRLTPSQHSRVLRKAKSENVPFSDIIRRGVEMVVPERGPA
jgi:hypothetical protein